MKNVIKLESRDSTKNFLKKMSKPDGSESKTYVLKTSSSYLRGGNLKGGNKFIDPSGGPMIVEGHKLEGTDYIVKSIDWIEGYGWTITFE